jgi:hypothetical protein
LFPNPPGLLRLDPHSEGLRERIWWGAGSNGGLGGEARQHIDASIKAYNIRAEPFVWTKEKVRRRRSKSRRITQL